jgi:hypothetical protein
LPIDRNHRARVIYRAESLERCTKEHGRPSGALGQTGLAVLRCLLFRFGDRPEASYKAIMRGTRFCKQTIAKALERLEIAGILIIERRSARTAAGYRVLTNRYSFKELLSLPAGQQEKPIKSLIPFEQLTGPLKAALDQLGERIAAHEITQESCHEL